MEELPVRAVHFGDTGTPLDSKEGRYIPDINNYYKSKRNVSGTVEMA